MKAIIPAAGLGKRFRPITLCIPKEMLPINNKPIIHYVIEEAIESGIDDISIITNKGKTIIEEYIDSINFKANICYIRQNVPRGLGDAILKAKNFIGKESFAILLGDDIIKSNTPGLKQLIDTYYETEKPTIALEAISNKENIKKYATVHGEFEDKRLFNIEKIIEKPKFHEITRNLGVIGRYVLTPDIFKYLEYTLPGYNDEIQLTDAIKELIKNNGLYGYVIDGKRYDCGYPDGYRNAVLKSIF